MRAFLYFEKLRCPQKGASKAPGKPSFVIPAEAGIQVFREALDPEWVVRSKKVIGGTAPERVREDIAGSREKILADKRILDQIEEKLTKAAHVLEAAIEEIVA